MRHAILTKYLGPTDHRGARITAKTHGGAITVPWDHSLNSEDNHTAAAKAYCAKTGWLDDDSLLLVGGWLPDNSGCFILYEKESL